MTGSRISCLDLWGLDISINTADLIEAYLCDLGSLPMQEQAHWLAHNVAPEGKMEEGRFRRDFLNQIAASPDPVRDLHRARAAAMESTRALLGTSLWKELDPQTQSEFDRLIGPTTTDPSALGPPTLTLTKAMADGIEPAPLRAFLGDAQRDEKSLALLGRFLERLGDTNDSIEPFKALQMFRSAGGVAHLSGSKAPAARDRLGIAGLSPWPAFVEVVQRLTVGLDRICALVAAANSEP